MKKITKMLLAATLCSTPWAHSADGVTQPADVQAKAAAQQQKLARLAGRATAKTAYTNLTLIDGTTTGPRPAVRTNMAIIVNGDRIGAILSMSQFSKEIADDVEVFDMHGMFALPGLIDSHVHYATQPSRVTAEAELRRNIYGGLTGVRDMAGDARALADLSRSSLLNEIPSPDIFYSALVAGPSFFADPRTVLASLGMQPGQVPWLYAVTGRSSLPLVIAQARGTGATGLKIYANLSGRLVRGLVREGKKQSFPVWTHQQVYPATPYDSLGATTVSHVCMIGRYVRDAGKDQYGHANEPTYAGLTADDPGIRKYIAALARSGTIMDATLSVYIPPPPAEGKPAAPDPHCPVQLAGDITRAMHRADIPVVAGTDTDTVPDDPYPALYGELDALVRYAGFTPYEAIVAATRNAARALGKESDFGTLEAGKFANMILLKEDPTQDIAKLHTLAVTVKRGHRFVQADYHHQPIPLPAED
ncbi:amidohydrolase family protein [Undibacterium sp. TJN25]|uniref:amidohydrolase family protein n=1 Tax=Undibacterium sp. TJN25 TaxID=3413056 RepID=UPI003BF220BD